MRPILIGNRANRNSDEAWPHLFYANPFVSESGNGLIYPMNRKRKSIRNISSVQGTPTQRSCRPNVRIHGVGYSSVGQRPLWTMHGKGGGVYIRTGDCTGSGGEKVCCRRTCAFIEAGRRYYLCHRRFSFLRSLSYRKLFRTSRSVLSRRQAAPS